MVMRITDSKGAAGGRQKDGTLIGLALPVAIENGNSGIGRSCGQDLAVDPMQSAGNGGAIANLSKDGDPYGNRTRVSAVKGPRPNR